MPQKVDEIHDAIKRDNPNVSDDSAWAMAQAQYKKTQQCVEKLHKEVCSEDAVEDTRLVKATKTEGSDFGKLTDFGAPKGKWKCPECGKIVDDKYWQCPKCGYSSESVHKTEGVTSKLSAKDKSALKKMRSEIDTTPIITPEDFDSELTAMAKRYSIDKDDLYDYLGGIESVHNRVEKLKESFKESKSDEDRIANSIYDMREKGLSVVEIAKKLNLNPEFVKNILGESVHLKVGKLNESLKEAKLDFKKLLDLYQKADTEADFKATAKSMGVSDSEILGFLVQVKGAQFNSVNKETDGVTSKKFRNKKTGEIVTQVPLSKIADYEPVKESLKEIYPAGRQWNDANESTRKKWLDAIKYYMDYSWKEWDDLDADLQKKLTTYIRKFLGESFKETSRNANKIMVIASDLLDKYNRNSGEDIGKEPLKSEFLAKVKSAVSNITGKDILDLENENYHTEIKVLIDAGLAKYPSSESLKEGYKVGDKVRVNGEDWKILKIWSDGSVDMRNNKGDGFAVMIDELPKKEGYLKGSELDKFGKLNSKLGDLSPEEFKDWKQLRAKNLGLESLKEDASDFEPYAKKMYQKPYDTLGDIQQRIVRTYSKTHPMGVENKKEDSGQVDMNDLSPKISDVGHKIEALHNSLKVTKKESVDSNELAMGIEMEKEHTDDEAIAKKIALDHLAEIPDYYTRLKKMEQGAKIEQ